MCVEPITSYKRPGDVKSLRKFLRMVNFYLRNVRNAALIQQRLQVLIKTNKCNDKTEIEWTEDAIITLEEFKMAIAEATLVAHPQKNSQLILSTDTSDTVLGGVLIRLLVKT